MKTRLTTAKLNMTDWQIGEYKCIYENLFHRTANATISSNEF